MKEIQKYTLIYDKSTKILAALDIEIEKTREQLRKLQEQRKTIADSLEEACRNAHIDGLIEAQSAFITQDFKNQIIDKQKAEEK